jgi:hypothetical protein
VDNWEPAKIVVLRQGRPKVVEGFVQAGMGIQRMAERSPDFPMPSIIALLHLGSGHVVTYLIGSEEEVFAAATEIVRLGDWTFDGIDGWRNVSPTLLSDVEAVVARYPGMMHRPGGVPDHEGARQVLDLREKLSARKPRRRRSTAD